MNPEWIKSAILIVFALTLLGVAIRRLRSYRLKERYALGLMFMGGPFLALAIWPAAVGRISRVLGIEYNTVSLLCVTAFLMLVVFELLTIVSVQDRKINALSQMVGLLTRQQGVKDGDGESRQAPSSVPVDDDSPDE